MPNREKRKEIAEETLSISKEGYYATIEGDELRFDPVFYSESEFWSQEYLELLTEKWGSIPPIQPIQNPEIVYMNENVVDTIFRLKADGEDMGKTCILNFASAKNPGGGFLVGSMAQEEALAYCSTLYVSQVGSPYYKENQLNPSKMYCDNMLFSKTLFFRDSNFELVKDPIETNVLTAPAVNMGQIKKKGQDPEKAAQVMKCRMGYVLDLMLEKECHTAVLGAWGCGVFGNDPYIIAENWKSLLQQRPYFKLVIMPVMGNPHDPASNAYIFEKFFG